MVPRITTVARRALVPAAAVVTAVMTAGPVSASTTVPLRATYRSCDFTEVRSASSQSLATATAVVHSSGRSVSADVHISEEGTPGAHFDVALIQMPRAASSPCTAPGPGVAVAGVDLDGAGQGSVTVQSALQSGATGVWVFVQRPSPYSQAPTEYYTSDFVAPV